MSGVNARRCVRDPFLIFLCSCVLLFSAAPAAAQKDKKKKKEAAAADPAVAGMALPDERQIDIAISEMLGAWQLGDVERLHKAYADDVSVVSGVWQPPVIGWTNYLADYQKQRARVQQTRMERENTYIRVAGTLAWACYQWEFSGVVDGQMSGARGQTTLLFEKRNGQWLIVHNHTSLVQAITQPAPPESKPPSP